MPSTSADDPLRDDPLDDVIQPEPLHDHLHDHLHERYPREGVSGEGELPQGGGEWGGATPGRG